MQEVQGFDQLWTPWPTTSAVMTLQVNQHPVFIENARVRVEWPHRKWFVFMIQTHIVSF
jgi:hypothetical protein